MLFMYLTTLNTNPGHKNSKIEITVKKKNRSQSDKNKCKFYNFFKEFFNLFSTMAITSTSTRFVIK